MVKSTEDTWAMQEKKRTPPGGGVGERESPEGPPKESSEDPAELPPPVEKITNLNKAGTKKPITYRTWYLVITWLLTIFGLTFG